MEDRSRGCRSRYWSRPIHTVGTPARTVTPSDSIKSQSAAGAPLNWPGEPAGAARPHDDHMLSGLELRRDLLEHGRQDILDEDHPVLGVIGDPGNLVGMQADVQGMQDRPHARHAEVQLEVARRIEAER